MRGWKGYLDAVLFTDGQPVKEGTPLYQIEKGLFQAAVEEAQGTLQRSEAAYTLAQLQTQRAYTSSAKTAEARLTATGPLHRRHKTKGAVLTDQVNLTTARINLGYTDIASPITGRIGRTSVTKGDVVGPESGSLTMIVSQNPMYVTFPVITSANSCAPRRASGTKTSPTLRCAFDFPTARYMTKSAR